MAADENKETTRRLIEREAAGGAYRLKAEQWLPVDTDELFPFFADPRNLELITPNTLRFEVVTPQPIEMHEGTIIDYRLKIRGIPARWRSEITIWNPPHRFMDEQRRGPYALWRHLHSFEPKDGGTLCRDEVEYRVPGGPLAPVVHALFVRPDLESIFAYRMRVLSERFGDGS
jgi:ligand-binding SRPBCC domain-containing protein